jgi:hypothetical protein
MDRRPGTALLRLMALIFGLFSVFGFADSLARIVRISDVQGRVQIDQATGQGYERAFLNLPIHQRMKLKTTADSRAEVEFDDGSVIHLTSNTVVQFSDLLLRDSGAKVSTLDLEQGEAYFNFLGQKDEEFTVTFGQQTARMTHPVHFRLKLEDTTASLAVIHGTVKVEGPSGEMEIPKGQTASFDFAHNGPAEVARKIEKEPFDAWDKQQVDYHEFYTAKALRAGYPYGYGLSDLYYYGSFLNIAGYGSCWQPYFTGLGWDPFMDGAWVWDPSFGYMWVSAYPWGWIPYHSGSWMYSGIASGWCWLQGNTWLNYYVPVIRPPLFRPPHGGPHRPPGSGGRIVAVGRGPTTSTLLAKNLPRSVMVVNAGDAGLGIPRGMHNLKQINGAFTQEGQVTLRVSQSRSSAGNVAAMPHVSLAASSGSSIAHAAAGSTMSSHTSTASVGSSFQTSASSHK